MSKLFFNSISARSRVADKSRPSTRRRFALEPLESRAMLSATAGAFDYQAHHHSEATAFEFAHDAAVYSQSRGVDRIEISASDLSHQSPSEFAWTSDRPFFGGRTEITSFSISPIREDALASRDDVFARGLSCSYACGSDASGSASVRSSITSRFDSPRFMASAPNSFSAAPFGSFGAFYILTVPSNHTVSYLEAPTVIGAANALIVDSTTNHQPQRNVADDRPVNSSDVGVIGNVFAPPLNRPVNLPPGARPNVPSGAAPGGNSSVAAAISAMLGGGANSSEQASQSVVNVSGQHSIVSSAVDAVIGAFGSTTPSQSAPSSASQGGLIEFGAWNSSLGKSVPAASLAADAIDGASQVIDGASKTSATFNLRKIETDAASSIANVDPVKVSDFVLDGIDFESLFSTEAADATINMAPDNTASSETEDTTVDPATLSPAELWAQSSTEGGLINVENVDWQGNLTDGLQDNNAAPASSLADAGEIRMDASVNLYQSFEVSDASRTLPVGEDSQALLDHVDNSTVDDDTIELISAPATGDVQDVVRTAQRTAPVVGQAADATVLDSPPANATPSTATPERSEKSEQTPEEAAPSVPAPVLATTAIVGMVALQVARRKREEQAKAPYRPRYPNER